MNLLFGTIPSSETDTHSNSRQFRPLEPGVIPVFRAFTWIRLGMLMLPILFAIIFAIFGIFGVFNFGPRNLDASSDVWFFQAQRSIEFISIVVLLIYLYWPRLPEIFGRFYLPIAILIATLEPILTQNFLITFVSDRLIDSEVIGGAWALLPILFAPLVLVAWQYNFRAVLLFVFGTTLIDIALLSVMTNQLGSALFPVYGAIGTRMVAMLIAGYLIVQLMKTQRTQRAALQKANAELRGYLVIQEQLTTSRERNRLARELHDTLAHTLSMLAVQLEAAKAVWDDEPAEAHHLLDQSLDATRAGLTETRRALQALRASPLEDLGLTIALQTLTDSVSSRNGLRVETRIIGLLSKLTPLVEQTIYRTAQEALANITQHAGAKNASLHLAEENGTLTLTISDDGRGFYQVGVEDTAHFGLRGLQERADMVGGTLTVESKSGEGTTITLRIELNDPSIDL
jgi:signal transduction histidine kinase